MTKSRLEAFSDGVIAIIITIMVLELKIPHGAAWSDITPLIPVFISYLASFIILGIYWGNHHHLVHTIRTVNSKIMWANLHLLFWLSLIPFATGWMGENHFANNTVAVYAILANLCGFSYYLLLVTIKKNELQNEPLQEILKKQSRKGLISLFAYALAVPAAYIHPGISGILFVFTGFLWIIPDKRIEKNMSSN
jgi:uncharacterized membrane protein